MIKQTQIELHKKPGTKTVWEKVGEETRSVTEEQYRNYVEAASFFRRLGGSVTQVKGYTKRGYLVSRDVTTDPQKQVRRVTEWDFDTSEMCYE